MVQRETEIKRMNPKKISPNVWQKNLRESDWKFSLCQNDEWEACLQWELGREMTQADNGGKSPTKHVFKNVADAMRARITPSHEEDLVKTIEVAWVSYIEKRLGENWKLEKTEQQDYLWISCSWNNLWHKFWDDVEYAVRRSPCPPVMEGETTQILPFKIPWHWRDDEILAAFSQWLKEYRPTGEAWDDRPAMPEPPKPTNKGGRGSKIGQAKAKLKALAAWRLLQHYNGDWGMAYKLNGVEQYLGKAFDHDSEWTSARKTVEAALKTYRPFFAFTDLG